MVITVVSYILLAMSCVFCLVIMIMVVVDIYKEWKSPIPHGGILFVSKNSGEIYANMYIDPIELEDGTVIKMTVAHLDTK